MYNISASGGDKPLERQKCQQKYEEINLRLNQLNANAEIQRGKVMQNIPLQTLCT